MNTKTKLLSALIGAGIITAATLTYAARPWYPCTYNGTIRTTEDECTVNCEGKREWKNTGDGEIGDCDPVGGTFGVLKDGPNFNGYYEWEDADTACVNAGYTGLASKDSIGCSLATWECDLSDELREAIGVNERVWLKEEYDADFAYFVDVYDAYESLSFTFKNDKRYPLCVRK